MKYRTLNLAKTTQAMELTFSAHITVIRISTHAMFGSIALPVAGGMVICQTFGTSHFQFSFQVTLTTCRRSLLSPPLMT
jgi:hypothetical protein